MLFIGQKDTHQPITNAVTGSSITQTIFNRMTRLATLSMVFTVMQQNFLILAEYGHSDRNGGILLKNRKNSAKIGMVGSYVNSNFGHMQTAGNFHPRRAVLNMWYCFNFLIQINSNFGHMQTAGNFHPRRAILNMWYCFNFLIQINSNFGHMQTAGNFHPRQAILNMWYCFNFLIQINSNFGHMQTAGNFHPRRAVLNMWYCF